MSKITLSLLLSLAVAATVSAEDLARTITVTGQGKASTPPDMATIQTGVITQAKTAQEALADNNRAMEKIMDVLKSKNIANKDMQTSGFHVMPEYAPHSPTQRGRASNQRDIVGYRVSNNLSVHVRNLARLGEILDALVQSGSNQLSGVSFGIADSKAITDVARKNAMDDARGRAELYSQAAGVKVGRVLSISEQAIQPPRPMFQARMAMAEMASSSVPIATGEQEVTATVHVMYELAD